MTSTTLFYLHSFSHLYAPFQASADLWRERERGFHKSFSASKTADQELDHDDCLQRPHPMQFQRQMDPRRCSRLSFQQTPKKRPRARTKSPVIQGELQPALSVQRSIMPT